MSAWEMEHGRKRSEDDPRMNDPVYRQTMEEWKQLDMMRKSNGVIASIFDHLATWGTGFNEIFNDALETNRKAWRVKYDI